MKANDCSLALALANERSDKKADTLSLYRLFVSGTLMSDCHGWQESDLVQACPVSGPQTPKV